MIDAYFVPAFLLWLAGLFTGQRLERLGKPGGIIVIFISAVPIAALFLADSIRVNKSALDAILTVLFFGAVTFITWRSSLWTRRKSTEFWNLGQPQSPLSGNEPDEGHHTGSNDGS